MIRMFLPAIALIFMLAASQSASAQADQSCGSLATQADRTACDQEIAEEANPDRRAELLYRRAYLNNEAQRYEEALADLNTVLLLNGNGARALRERAYALNALGRYSEAEADLNAQTQLAPSDSAFYQERAFARFYQGNLEGAFADRDQVVQLSPNDSGALVARAEAQMWLGHWDAARTDIDAAAALANGDEAQQVVGKARANLAAWSTPTANGDPHTLCDLHRIEGASAPANIIGDCTALFLGAATGVDKGDALTVRSVALSLSGDEDSVVDLQIAAALDPENWQRHANLGQAFLGVHHSWAARNEFDRALALQQHWVSLSGRAVANLALGDTDAARRDAEAAMRLEPNHQSAMVLGDIAYQAHDITVARRYYLQAYQLGSRDDTLMERLHTVGVTDPEHTRR